MRTLCRVVKPDGNRIAAANGAATPTLTRCTSQSVNTIP